MDGDKWLSPRGLPLPLPISRNETFQPRRRLRAGNVAGDSDKVTTGNNSDSREGENRVKGPSKGHLIFQGCHKRFLHPMMLLGKPEPQILGCRAGCSTGMLLFSLSLLKTISQTFASPSKLSSQPNSWPLIYKPAAL